MYNNHGLARRLVQAVLGPAEHLYSYDDDDDYKTQKHVSSSIISIDSISVIIINTIMLLYMYVYVYTCIHTYIYIYTHVYTHVYTYHSICIQLYR